VHFYFILIFIVIATDVMAQRNEKLCSTGVANLAALDHAARLMGSLGSKEFRELNEAEIESLYARFPDYEARQAVALSFVPMIVGEMTGAGIKNDHPEWSDIFMRLYNDGAIHGFELFDPTKMNEQNQKRSIKDNLASYMKGRLRLMAATYKNRDRWKNRHQLFTDMVSEDSNDDGETEPFWVSALSIDPREQQTDFRLKAKAVLEAVPLFMKQVALIYGPQSKIYKVWDSLIQDRFLGGQTLAFVARKFKCTNENIRFSYEIPLRRKMVEFIENNRLLD
jgi:hypothetical protein